MITMHKPPPVLRAWGKALMTVTAIVLTLATLVAGAIESRVRMSSVEGELRRHEERDLLGDERLINKLDEIGKVLVGLHVEVARLTQRLDDFLGKEHDGR